MAEISVNVPGELPRMDVSTTQQIFSQEWLDGWNPLEENSWVDDLEIKNFSILQEDDEGQPRFVGKEVPARIVEPETPEDILRRVLADKETPQVLLEPLSDDELDHDLEPLLIQKLKDSILSIKRFGENITKAQFMAQLGTLEKDLTEKEKTLCLNLLNSCLSPVTQVQEELESQVSLLLSEGKDNFGSFKDLASSKLLGTFSGGILESEATYLTQHILQSYDDQVGYALEMEKAGADFAYTLALGFFHKGFFEVTSRSRDMTAMEDEYTGLVKQAMDAFLYAYNRPPTSTLAKECIQKLTNAFQDEREQLEKKMKDRQEFNRRLNSLKTHGTSDTSVINPSSETFLQRPVTDVTMSDIPSTKFRPSIPKFRSASPTNPSGHHGPLTKSRAQQPKGLGPSIPTAKPRIRQNEIPIPIGIMFGRDSFCVTLNNKEGRLRNIHGPIESCITFLQDGEIVLGPLPTQGHSGNIFLFKELLEEVHVGRTCIANLKHKTTSEIYACALGLLHTLVTKALNTSNLYYVVSHPSAVNAIFLRSLKAAQDAAGMSSGILIPESTALLVYALQSGYISQDIVVVIEESSNHKGYELALYQASGGAVTLRNISGYRQDKGVLWNGPSGLKQGLDALKSIIPKNQNLVLFHCNVESKTEMLKGLRGISGRHQYLVKSAIAQGCAIFAKYQTNPEFRTDWEQVKKFPKLGGLVNPFPVNVPIIQHKGSAQCNTVSVKGALDRHFQLLAITKKEIQEKYIQMQPQNEGLDNAIRAINKEYLSIQSVKEKWSNACNKVNVKN